MILRAVIGLVVAFLIGAALVAVFWPEEKQRWQEIVLRFALASGIGLGVSSIGFFLALCAFGSARNSYFLADGVILLLVALTWWRKSGSSRNPKLPLRSQAAPVSSAAKLLGSALAAVSVLAVAGFVRLSIRKPHGEFDAWTIWNLHARFLFRGRDHWVDMFSAHLPTYNSRVVTGIVSKPDYPLLLPASIARLWHYAGNEALFIPALVGGIFTFATAALLVSLVARSRDSAQGYLAGLILLGTPAFIVEGAHQFADVPVGFFLLATLGLLYLYDCHQDRGYLILAGTTAGLSLWTKNEGFVVVAAIFCVRWIFGMKFPELKSISRHSVWFLSSMLPFLATVVYFKLRFAGSNDMLAGQGIQAHAARFTSLIRYAITARAFAWQAWNFGDWPIPIVLVLAGYALLAGLYATSKDAFVPLATVVTAAAGYFFIYIGTPHQLQWHLRYSLDRVFMQLWPSALFGLLILLNTSQAAVIADRRTIDSEPTRQAEDLLSS